MFNFHHFGRGRSGRVGGQRRGRIHIGLAARIVAALSILAGGIVLVVGVGITVAQAADTSDPSHVVTGEAFCTDTSDLYTIVLSNTSTGDIGLYNIVPDGTGTDTPSLGIGIYAGGSGDPYFTDSDNVTFEFTETGDVTVSTTGLDCLIPVVTMSGQCALVEGTPTYTYEISESAVVDATYEIFDDTKTGERGLLPGGETLFWTTLDPEILVSINDGYTQTVTPTACVVPEPEPPVVSVVAGTPVRIADLSDFTAGVVRCVPVVGLADVPVGAVGVLFNVTAAGAAGPGNVVVYPDYLNNGASPPPNASTVNFEPGADVANSATVALPANGQVCAFSQGAPLGRLILDVTGYILPGSGITLQNSVRLVDTRGGGYHVGSIVGPVEPLTPYTVQVTGNAGVPVGATAVFANVTVTGVTSGGHLRMWEAGTPMPNTSVVNYAPGQDKANGQIIALSADGQLSFASMTGAGTASNPVQVIIDVVGYVEAGAQFVGTAPTRVVETRTEYGIIGPIPGPLTPVTVYPVTIGTGLVPVSATAVVLNVTAVGPTGPGHLRVYPDTNGAGTTPPPDTSNINYIPGRDIPNMITVQLPTDRTIDFYNVQGGSNTTNLVVDVIGYIDGGTN